MVLLHRRLIVRKIVWHDVLWTAHKLGEIRSARLAPQVNLLLHRGQAPTKRAACGRLATILTLARRNDVLEASVRCQFVGRSQLLPAGHAQVSGLRGLAHAHRAMKCGRSLVATVAEFLFVSGHDERRAR